MPLDQSTKVHEAAHVPANNLLSATGHDVLQLLHANARRYRAVGGTKRTAKTAALLLLIERHYFDPGQTSDELFLLILKANSATMASAVKCYFSPGGGFLGCNRPFRHLHLVDQKLTEFEYEWVPHTLVQKRISFANHRRTRSTRGDHWIFRIEKRSHRKAGCLPRGGPIARVKGWLSTTGLVFIKSNLAASVLKDTNGRNADFAKVAVADTSEHQPNALTWLSLVRRCVTDVTQGVGHARSVPRRTTDARDSCTNRYGVLTGVTFLR